MAKENLPFGPFRNKRLFSDHFLEKRLPRTDLWRDPPNLSERFDKAKALYEAKRSILPSLNEAQTESEFIRPLLEALGFAYIPQTATSGGRPDLALFADEAAKNAAYSNIQSDNYADALGIAEVKYWERPLDQYLQSKRERFTNANPNFQIINYLTGTQATWGVLTNGKLWRIYTLRAHPAIDTYYEVDLVQLLESNDLEAFKYFLLFFRKEAFATDEKGKCFLDYVFDGSERYRVEVEDDLRVRIREVLLDLGRGFVKAMRDQGEEITKERLKEIYKNSLILMYRVLFILYAESRGLLPMGNETYRRRYSFAHIKNGIQDVVDNRSGAFSDVQTDYYDTIRNLCHAINVSDPSVGIPFYNGGLFNPKNYPFLEEWRVADAFMARAIDALARREVTGETKPVSVDYHELSERQLGSIYEILLEFHFELKQGELDILTDRGERKATGSYYTPDYIVKYIVKSTLGPLAGEVAKKVKADKKRNKQWTSKEKKLALRRYLDLKVLDPAMGSGHFLVEAVKFLAKAIATDSEIDLRHEDFGLVLPSEEAEDPLVLELKRLVVENCIFGVDLNHLTVELAKLSLWLSTLAKDKPLSFLDHHLKVGNSLIGAKLHDMGELPMLGKRTKRPKAAVSFAEKNFEENIERIITIFEDIERMPSDTHVAVKKKEKIFGEAELLLSGHRTLAHAWVSNYFGGGVSAGEYNALEKALGKDIAPEANEEPAFGFLRAARLERLISIVEEKRFFHWELEFPEIFFGERKETPGFDAVIGNPPYLFLSGKGSPVKRLIKEGKTEEAKKLELEIQYLAKTYPKTSKGMKDYYKWFTNRGILLTTKKGYFSFIISNTWIAYPTFKDIRHLLSEANTTVRLLDVGVDVFPDPVVPASVFLIQNKLPSESRFPFLDLKTIPRKFLESSFSQFVGNEDNWKIIHYDAQEEEYRIFKNPIAKKHFQPEMHQRLKDDLTIHEGEHSLSLAVEEILSQQGTGTIPVILDWEMGRYTQPSYGYLPEKYCPEYDRAFHDGERILIRKTGDTIVSATAPLRNLAIAHQNVYVAKPVTISANYMLSLLNSKLLTFFYQNSPFGQKNRPHAQFRIDFLYKLPIPRIKFTTPKAERKKHAEAWKKSYGKNESAPGLLETVRRHIQSDKKDVVHDILAFLAEEMTRMHKRKQEEMRSFLAWLEGEIKAEIDDLTNKTKIRDYPSLEDGVDELLEILKQNKRKLGANPSSREFQEAVKREYEKSLGKLKPLLARIEATDRLIDQIVYRLYGLTPEEIKVVENV